MMESAEYQERIQAAINALRFVGFCKTDVGIITEMNKIIEENNSNAANPHVKKVATDEFSKLKKGEPNEKRLKQILDLLERFLGQYNYTKYDKATKKYLEEILIPDSTQTTITSLSKSLSGIYELFRKDTREGGISRSILKIDEDGICINKGIGAEYLGAVTVLSEGKLSIQFNLCRIHNKEQPDIFSSLMHFKIGSLFKNTILKGLILSWTNNDGFPFSSNVYLLKNDKLEWDTAEPIFLKINSDEYHTWEKSNPNHANIAKQLQTAKIIIEAQNDIVLDNEQARLYFYAAQAEQDNREKYLRIAILKGFGDGIEDAKRIEKSPVLETFEALLEYYELDKKSRDFKLLKQKIVNEMYLT